MHSKEDHDRFCPCAQTEQECDLISVETDRCVSCECPRIALVRADEREKAAQRVESCVNKFKARDFNDAVDACAAAVRGKS